jgi:hypothetical protein
MTTLQKTLVTVAIAVTSVTIFELVQQNSALRDDIQSLETTGPRIDELQRRRDAADKELVALRAQVIELKRTSGEKDR